MNVLARLREPVSNQELGPFVDGTREGGPTLSSEAILRSEKPIGIAAVVGVVQQAMASHDGKRSDSDAWLAPRVHAALRLTCREASDRLMWSWLALGPLHDYVRWRWGKDGSVNVDRFVGPVHKQAIMRLWWAGEFFRHGPDYSPVRTMMRNQDIPNSILHRPFVRNRPFALATSEVFLALPSPPTSDQINDYARKVNCRLASRSIEAATAEYRDDAGARRIWIDAPVAPMLDGALPLGPEDGCIDPSVLAAAREIAQEVAALAFGS